MRGAVLAQVAAEGPQNAPLVPGQLVPLQVVAAAGLVVAERAHVGPAARVHAHVVVQLDLVAALEAAHVARVDAQDGRLLVRVGGRQVVGGWQAGRGGRDQQPPSSFSSSYLKRHLALLGADCHSLSASARPEPARRCLRPRPEATRRPVLLLAFLSVPLHSL